MVSKPTVIPKFAALNVVSPDSEQNNVVEPPPEKQDSGWDFLEFPPRNFMNWIHRYTYQWIIWFKQQEEQAVVTDGNGVSLFPIDGALITLNAVDSANPGNYITAVGYKESGVDPVLNVIDANGLSLGTGTITGNQPISGGTAGDIIVWGQSKIIPS